MSVASITSGASVAATAPAAFDAAALRRAEPAAQRKAAAQQFEAVLVRQLLGKTMNSMLGGSAGGVAGSVYGDMLADTISQQLTSGPGLGLGRFIEQQLAPKGNAAAQDDETAGTSPAPQVPSPRASIIP